MTDYKKLGALVARDLFAIGDEYKAPTTRIAFISGQWPDNERAQGGLCEDALARDLATILEKHLENA
jgi:hypothetical protein